MKLKSIKRMFSAAFWLSLAISALAAVEPVYAVTPLAYLQSQTAPSYRSGNTMLRLTRCGWPYLGSGDGGQLDFDTQKELAGRWGYVMQCDGWAGAIVNYGAAQNSFTNPNSVGSKIVQWCKNNPGYEAHVWESRDLPSFAQAPSCYLRRADGSAITKADGSPIWSPAAPDSELLNISQQRINALNVGRQYGPITYMGNMGEYAQILLSSGAPGADGDMINYYSQDPTVMAAKGSTDWFSYVSAAKAHMEIVMHSRVAAGIPELKHHYWYPNGGGFDRNRYGWWIGSTWGYEWMRNITKYPSEQFYLADSNGGFTGPDDALTKELNSTGWQIRLGHPLSYTWVESARGLNGDSSAERRWIGCLKALYTLGTLGVNVGGYIQTSPLNQPDVDPANPPFWMREITNASRVQGLFSYLEPFLRRSDLLSGPNSHRYSTDNPAYEFPVANDPNARVVARKMTDANRWLITAWAMSGSDRSVSVTIPVLGTVTLLARDVGSVYHYANGTLTQLDSSDGTLVTLNTGTLNAQFGDLYSAAATSNAADDATFISQSVPTTMVAGQQYAVSVTMKNNGTATWNHDGSTPYNLGSQNAQDNTTWGFNRVEVPGSISRGNLTTFNFTVTAPSATGTYNCQWKMVHDGVTWFGAQTPNVPVSVIAMPTVNDDAQFISQSVPSTMNAGQQYAVSVTMKNTGMNTWTTGGAWRLGSMNPRDNNTWGMNRVQTGATVATGQTFVYTFNVNAPSTPGNYNFQWQMVHDGVTWFGALSTNIVVTVTSGGGPVDGGIYELTPKHASSKSLDVYGAGTADGSNVIIWTYGGGANQKWLFTDLHNGNWRLSPTHATNKCLDVSGAGTADGTNVQIWTYGGSGLNQQWQLTDVGGGYYRISPAHATNQCLDVYGAGTADGSNVQIWTYGGGDNQKWKLTAAAASASMAVSGSGVISDNTGVYDYGAMATGSFLDHTFTITNNGSSALNLTGSPKVTISGTNAADFSVTAQPASSVAAGSYTLNFQAARRSGQVQPIKISG